jgi:chromosome segregation ATPase
LEDLEKERLDNWNKFVEDYSENLSEIYYRKNGELYLNFTKPEETVSRGTEFTFGGINNEK